MTTNTAPDKEEIDYVGELIGLSKAMFPEVDKEDSREELIEQPEFIRGTEWLRSFASRIISAERERTLDEVEKQAFNCQLTDAYKFLLPYKSLQEICNSLRSPMQEREGTK